jgi:hypothetical protein
MLAQALPHRGSPAPPGGLDQAAHGRLSSHDATNASKPHLARPGAPAEVPLAVACNGQGLRLAVGHRGHPAPEEGAVARKPAFALEKGVGLRWFLGPVRWAKRAVIVRVMGCPRREMSKRRRLVSTLHPPPLHRPDPPRLAALPIETT